MQARDDPSVLLLGLVLGVAQFLAIRLHLRHRQQARAVFAVDDGRDIVIEEHPLALELVFTEDQVSFEGTYYRTVKSECRPKTVQQPRPPILIAAGGPQILEVAGREAEIVAVIPPGAGVQPPALDDVAPAGVRRQLDIVRRAAGPRFAAFCRCTTAAADRRAPSAPWLPTL